VKAVEEINAQLIYWITERDAIRKRKEAGESPPWSDNPVMCETYFCNVNREDDKVTKWIRQNWRPEMTDNYEFAMVVARMLNKPSTLEAIGIPPLIERWLHPDGDWLTDSHYKLLQMQQDKITVFNGAYIVSTNGKKMNKIDYVFMLFEQMVRKPLLHGAGLETCAAAHKQLMEIEGLASFMSAQVVADLKNSPGHPLYHAPDKRTFSAFGPGSLRGLSWYYGKEIKPNTYQEAIDTAYTDVQFDLPPDIMAILCHQNLQNCFCEFDKFMRVSTGTGRSKRKYNARH